MSAWNVPSVRRSLQAIFGFSYGPGTMKFVISDPKKPRIQMEKVWDDFSFLKSKSFIHYFPSILILKTMAITVKVIILWGSDRSK